MFERTKYFHRQGSDKMALKHKIKNNISKTIENTLGISYEEFEQLELDEQKELIAMLRKNFDEAIPTIGTGENSIFTKVKKGKRVMIGSGEHSCSVRAGISSEEARKELNNKMDDAFYSKPVALIKKIQRRIRNK